MFDARSILDALVKGGQPQGGARPSGGGDLGGIGDLLKQLAGADDRSPAPAGRAPTTRSAQPAPTPSAPDEPPAEEEDAPPPRRAPTRTRPSARDEDADS